MMSCHWIFGAPQIALLNTRFAYASFNELLQDQLLDVINEQNGTYDTFEGIVKALL